MRAHGMIHGTGKAHCFFQLSKVFPSMNLGHIPMHSSPVSLHTSSLSGDCSVFGPKALPHRQIHVYVPGEMRDVHDFAGAIAGSWQCLASAIHRKGSMEQDRRLGRNLSNESLREC